MFKELKLGQREVYKGISIEGATEEGIRSIINFLKEKIPGFKVKVKNIDVTEEVMDGTDSVKQLMQDDEETGSGEDSDGEIDHLEEIQHDGAALEAADGASEDGKDLDTKLFIGGVVHNNEDTPTKDNYVCLPANVKDMERDYFVLRVPGRSLDYDNGKSKLSKVKVAAIAAQGVSELMPSEIAKAFWSSKKASSKR